MSKSEVQIEPNLDSVMPSMNLTVPPPTEKQELVDGEMLLGVFGEILNNLRADREEMTGYITNFAEMVFNESDGTSASKEALVNLVKTKSETGDKMAKIADLMARVHIKQDHFPAYLAAHAHQNNTININDSAAKRSLLKAIERAQLKKKEEGQSST